MSSLIIAGITILIVYVGFKLIQAYLGGNTTKEEMRETVAQALSDVVTKVTDKAKEEIPKALQGINSLDPTKLKEVGKETISNIIKNSGQEVIDIVKNENPINHEAINPFLEKLFELLNIKEKEDLLTDTENNTYIISDDLEHPFRITPAITAATKKIVGNRTGQFEIAHKIFEWFEENIKYGDDKRGPVGYRNSLEVFTTKEGVCGEMSILYVVMVRSQGVKANYCSVTQDYSGKDVNHACAAIKMNNGSIILVDPAYHVFDIKHKAFKILTDPEAIETFKQWR